MKNLSGLCLIMFSVIISGCSSDKPWENLVRKDLSNWIELNGTAPFELKNGEITGTTVFESPNSFLCTKEKYGDFILEFDTWFDPQMNSGVQFRSESLPDYQDGRVHGYQVEMDPSSRSWSGGIYDEARRGWLYTLDKNQEAKKALKVGDWNHYRVEAIGNSIRTWVNAIPCADLIDAMTPEGFIALQVHSVGNDSSKIGLLVKWKNIKIITKDVEKYATPYEPVIPQISFLDNLLTEREKALIALAVAHTVQCPYCIDAYTSTCLAKGADEEQMMEAVHVSAAIRAGASLVNSVMMMNQVKQVVM